MTYYDVLGVSQTASDEDIRSAYRNLLKAFHPDYYTGDKKFAEAQTQKLVEAYTTLRNKEDRANYDFWLSRNSDLGNNRENSNSTQTQYTPPPEPAPQAEKEEPKPFGQDATGQGGPSVVVGSAEYLSLSPAERRRLSPLKLNWYKFYTYFRLPVGCLLAIEALQSAYYTFNDLIAGAYGTITALYFCGLILAVVSQCVLLVYCTFALHKLSKNSYTALIFLILLEGLVIGFNLTPMLDSMTASFLLNQALVFCVWIIPNLRYFHKRRYLFVETPISEVGSISSTAHSNVLKYGCGVIAVVVFFSITLYQGFEVPLDAFSRRRYLAPNDPNYYHSWDCEIMLKTPIEDLIYAKDRFEAIEYGYNPCPQCFPAGVNFG